MFTVDETRKAVDLSSLRGQKSFTCEVCNSILSFLEGRLHTSIWYCTKCNLYKEYSKEGILLRTFFKEEKDG